MQQGGLLSLKERLPPKGEVDLFPVAVPGGREIGMAEAVARFPLLRRDLAAAGFAAGLPEHVHIDNLVVNTGRSGTARLLGFAGQPFITKFQVGDCKVGGVVQKVENPPDRTDTGLVNEIRRLDGNPGATFDVDTVTQPDRIIKVNQVGPVGVLVAGNLSTLTDASANFVTAGVTTEDTVNVVIDGEDFEFGINAVVSATQLEIQNPFNIASGAVVYTIQTPGTQVRFVKRVLGNSFPVAEYGNPVIAHEAGMLFSTGILFNRITIVGENNNVGLPLRPDSIDGVALDVILQWTITF